MDPKLGAILTCWRPDDDDGDDDDGDDHDGDGDGDDDITSLVKCQH